MRSSDANAPARGGSARCRYSRTEEPSYYSPAARPARKARSAASNSRGRWDIEEWPAPLRVRSRARDTLAQDLVGRPGTKESLPPQLRRVGDATDHRARRTSSVRMARIERQKSTGLVLRVVRTYKAREPGDTRQAS